MANSISRLLFTAVMVFMIGCSESKNASPPTLSAVDHEPGDSTYSSSQNDDSLNTSDTKPATSDAASDSNQNRRDDKAADSTAQSEPATASVPEDVKPAASSASVDVQEDSAETNDEPTASTDTGTTNTSQKGFLQSMQEGLSAALGPLNTDSIAEALKGKSPLKVEHQSNNDPGDGRVVKNSENVENG